MFLTPIWQKLRLIVVHSTEVYIPLQIYQLQYHEFDVQQGLEALRELISNVNKQNEGILLVGDVGITSHFGDVLRRAEIPSKIIPHDEIAVTQV